MKGKWTKSSSFSHPIYSILAVCSMLRNNLARPPRQLPAYPHLSALARPLTPLSHYKIRSPWMTEDVSIIEREQVLTKVEKITPDCRGLVWSADFDIGRDASGNFLDGSGILLVMRFSVTDILSVVWRESFVCRQVFHSILNQCYCLAVFWVFKMDKISICWFHMLNYLLFCAQCDWLCSDD